MTANRERKDGAHELERVFRGLVLAGLAVFTVALFQAFQGESGQDKTSAALGLAVCAGLLVPWARLPFLKDKVRRPEPIMSLVSRVLFGVSAGVLPSLVYGGHWLFALGALLTCVACGGMWLAWVWSAWLWYALSLAAIVLGSHALWSDVRTAILGVRTTLDFALRLPGLLLWLAFVFELVPWHRALLEEKKQHASDSGGPPAVTPGPGTAEERTENDA